MHHHHISTDYLTIDHLAHVLKERRPLALSPEATAAIARCRTYLEQKIASDGALHYGINTGFGSLCNVAIPAHQIEELQENLVRSHAAGTGDLVPPEVVRIMLLLKTQSLSYGNSGVRVEVVQRLVDFYNADILPEVFQLGSLGASGDLAPLAHLSLPLIGEGFVWQNGQRYNAADILAKNNWKPLRFQAKEALALLNGTQFSTAYGVWALLQARRLESIALFNAALAYDAFNCRYTPLDARIHRVRPHAGQVATAAALLQWLDGSPIGQLDKTSVQDPYAFRCVPQVHGASSDTLAYAQTVLETEANSVTDNPNIFPDDDLIVSGGNFHAQPIALALDFMAIALSELGSISERRVYQLISGQRGLPAFLTPDPGLHSGLMIAQYTAASIVSQNKGLCMPASVDSIVSCNGQEDHVSMAANAGTKLYRVVQNLERLLAIELLTAAQALEFRRPHRSSAAIEAVVAQYRTVVPKITTDRIIHQDIEQTIGFLRGTQPFDPTSVSTL
jgi:histidine ammonia-lyase